MSAPPAATSPPRTRLTRAPALLALLALCAASLALSAWLLERHPVLYWNDGYDRLAHREQLVVWRWLPLFQALLLASSEIATRVESVRLVLALLAAGAVAGGYALTARLFGRVAGLACAALLAGNALLVTLATVPYQEPLFALQLFAVFALLHRPAQVGAAAPLPGRRGLFLAAVVSTSACLNRYEGWFLFALVGVEAGLRSWRAGGRLAALGRAALAALAFGGAVVLWWVLAVPIELHARETAITQRLDPAAAWGVLRPLGGEMIRQTSTPFVLLGLAGIALAWRDRSGRTTHLRIAAFLLMHLGLIVLADPAPALRRPFVFLVLLTPYAGHAVVRASAEIARHLRSLVARRGVVWVATLGVLAIAVHGARTGAAQVRRFSRARPELAAVEAACSALRERLEEDQLVVAAGEGSRRAVSVHAWVSLRRVLDGLGPAPLSAGDLRELALADGVVYLVLDVATGAPILAVLDELATESSDLRVERVPPAELPRGAAELWTVRTR